MSGSIHGNKAFFNGEFLSRMEEGKAIHLCDVPAGSKVRQVASADPMVQRFVIAHPEHPPKIIEIGPEGVIVTTNEISPDMTFEIGIGDAKAAEDMMLYGINVTLDGERVDPMDFFIPDKPDETK